MNFSYCNRHLFDMLDLLVEKYNWEYVSKNDLIDESFKYKTFYEKIEHLLLITGSSQIKEFKVPKSCKISYIIDDLHTGGEIKKARMTNHKLVYKIFATYGYCFEKYYPMIPKEKMIWFPHSARYILEINNNPINKILVSGRFSKSQYPNRFKIIEYSKKDNFIHYEKPKLNGYRASNESDIKNRLYGKKFYNILNKYLICFTCDANESRPYIVAKHFEILGSGSLLFACNPHTKKEFESLGFIDGEDYISCNSENMEEKINWLRNPENLYKINEIRNSGNRKIKQHSWLKRTELLNHILK